MSHDKDNSDFMGQYGQQLRKLRADVSCPSTEKLGIYVTNELGSLEAKKLDEHFDMCPACLDVVRQLQENRQQESELVAPGPNWATLEKKMDEKMYAHLESLPPIPELAPHAADLFERFKTAIARLLAPPNFAYAGLATALVLTSLYGYAFFNRPEYFQLAKIQYQTTGAVRIQAGQENDLTRGLQAFELKKYQQAISLLRAYLKTDASHYLANFELGLAYLFTAKQNLPGLAYGFDHEKVDRGIHYLKMAQAAAVDNPYYQEECLWYLAKARLMAGKATLAKQNLQRLLTLAQPGSDKKQAVRDLLVELEK